MNARTYILDHLCEHNIHAIQVFYLHTPPRHGRSCIDVHLCLGTWQVGILPQVRPLAVAGVPETKLE